MITEEYLLEVRKEIISRCNANDRLFDKMFAKIPKKIKNNHPGLEHEFLEFCFDNIYFKQKDINRFMTKLYNREILKEQDDSEL